MLLEDRTSKNTKRVINSAKRLLDAFCSETGHCYDGMNKGELNILLQQFYAGMRSNKGEEYCKRSMISMRYLILKTAHVLLKGFKISNWIQLSVGYNLNLVLGSISLRNEHLVLAELLLLFCQTAASLWSFRNLAARVEETNILERSSSS